eukprot:1748339-Prymnesium_polylepis.1
MSGARPQPAPCPHRGRAAPRPHCAAGAPLLAVPCCLLLARRHCLFPRIARTITPLALRLFLLGSRPACSRPFGRTRPLLHAT